MFKTNQIIRNKKTGCALRVINWPLVQRVSAPRIGRAPVGKVFTVAFIDREVFDLIGNNYKEQTQ